MKLAIYMTLWLFVAAVASIDTYINIRYPVTVHSELNPLGKAILQVSNNDHALLLAIKFAGTTMALAYLLLLYFNNRKLAYRVMCGVALFQLFFLAVVFW